MRDVERRQLLIGAAAIGSLATGAAAQAAEKIAADAPRVEYGASLVPEAESNPLAAKIAALTVVSPDLAASTAFYRDVMGYTLADEGALSAGLSTAPGVGKAGRRYLLFNVPKGSVEASIRVLEAPAGAGPIRPRPGSMAWDPGLLVMECLTQDPAESYLKLGSAKTPVISPPRYYPIRGMGRPIDPMSYAAFGPGGEQIFITAVINDDRPDWNEPGLHTIPGSFSLVSLDQRPVEAFYRNALGLGRITQLVAQSRNCNEIIGAPRDANFLWGNVGAGVNMEVWEFKARKGTLYPTSLDRTGLAMVTLRVNDLEKCRTMCKQAGIALTGEGALPIVGRPRPAGFTLRGAIGELIEVIGA
jgi:catechol 2,3-dioxygenase-like lactoylglutathione lyase family enzyme